MKFLSEEHIATAKANGINYKNLFNRVYELDWEIDRAITEPVKKHSGLWQEYKEIAKSHGISGTLFHARVKRGLDPKEAATLPLMSRTDSARKAGLTARLKRRMANGKSNVSNS
jgi:hypothetical protein